MFNSPHLSSLMLEKLHLGMLDDPDGTLRAHCETCPRCQEQLAALHAADARFLERFPTEAALVQKSHARSPGRPIYQRWPTAALVGLALAAVVALMLVRPSWYSIFHGAPSAKHGAELAERIKGQSIMEIAVSRAGSSFQFYGQPLLTGDTLVFRYTSNRSFLMLLSLEASGKAQVLLPTDAQMSMPIERGAKIRLQQGVELDDYLGPELLVALFSDEPLSAEEVIAEVRRRHASIKGEMRSHLVLGPLPFAADELSWLLKKERP
jgi:hypothetical protein